MLIVNFACYCNTLICSHIIYLWLLFPGSINYVIKNTSLLSYYDSMATIDCSLFYYQTFYCVVCCSTDPSVPPDSSVYNISTTRGTEVTVSLQGFTSGQMYYCKAAATNTNSNNCTGPVVGGVKVFFSFIASPFPHSNVPNPAGMSAIYLIIVHFGASIIVSFGRANNFIQVAIKKLL